MIDYCTIVVDKNEVRLLRMHLNSLKHHAGNLFNFKISVPEGLLSLNVEFVGICEEFDAEVLIHPIYTQKLAPKWGLRQAGFDCANRMEKLMQACTSDWVFLSQSDIIWTGNPMPQIKTMMNDSYGMLGIWPHGCTIVNREVYAGCHHGFWPNGGWLGWICSEKPTVTVQMIGNTEGKERHWWTRASDKRGLVNIDGVDVGMLLRMEVQGYGYNFDYAGALPYYYHIGGASYHGLTDTPGDIAIKEEINNRIDLALEKFKELT